MFLENSPLQRYLSAGQPQLPPEVDDSGNVEYKWRLLEDGVDEERRRHLVTQMRWRVAEGSKEGYCWYILGVKDKGTLDGLSEAELRETLSVMEDLAGRAQLSITARQIIPLPASDRFIGQVKLEAASPSSEQASPGTRDLKVALVGDSGCGKTTLLSVLTDEAGGLDDGRGAMRARLLHHRHELITGSTSSITQRSLVYSSKVSVSSTSTGTGTGTGTGRSAELLPLPSDPSLLTPSLKRQILSATRCVHLIDSAGKLRFDRSMLAVLTAVRSVDGVCLVVEAPPALDASFPAYTLSPQSRQLLTLIRGLNLRLLGILITKIDESSTESLGVLLEELGEACGQPLQLFDGTEAEWAGEAESACKNRSHSHSQSGSRSQSISHSRSRSQSLGNLPLHPPSPLPVLLCSAVTGDFLDSLRLFFSLIPATPTPQPRCAEFPLLAEQPGLQSALLIESVSQVPQIGTVVWGQVVAGVMHVGAEVVQMPSSGTQLKSFRVASIERLKIPVRSAQPGQYVTLALSGDLEADREDLQRGQLLCVFDPISSSSSASSSSPSSTTSSPRPHFKPLKRIIAELTHAPPSPSTCLSGLLFIGSQRFGAQLDLDGSRGMGRQHVCLVTMRAGEGAGVFLEPGAGFVFVETGRGSRERFIGRVLDYFSR